MAIFTPNVGLLTKLDTIRTSAGNMAIYLYKNDYTPVAGTVLGSFVECDFPGYGGKNANFGPAVIGASGKAEITSPLFTFTMTAAGNQTVYGYFVTDVNKTLLLFCERFAAPVQLTLAGDTLRLQVVDQLGNA